MRKSIKLPEGTEELWHRFRVMCLRKQTGGNGLANRQLVELIKAWRPREGDKMGYKFRICKQSHGDRQRFTIQQKRLWGWVDVYLNGANIFYIIFYTYSNREEAQIGIDKFLGSQDFYASPWICTGEITGG